MKYNVSFKLVSPKKDRSVQVKAMFEITKSGCFSYGNEKCMVIKWEDHEAMGDNQMFDIRYDRRYSSKDERGYIKTFIRDRWDGKDGAWKAQYINIKTKFEL